jgi:hypothetical protein
MTSVIVKTTPLLVLVESCVTRGGAVLVVSPRSFVVGIQTDDSKVVLQMELSSRQDREIKDDLRRGWIRGSGRRRRRRRLRCT